MGMGVASGGRGGGRGRRGRKKAVMSEINITPMVDVMLVLLIIFMVAAPMMTAGVPIDLPKTAAADMRRWRAGPHLPARRHHSRLRLGDARDGHSVGRRVQQDRPDHRAGTGLVQCALALQHRLLPTSSS